MFPIHPAWRKWISAGATAVLLSLVGSEADSQLVDDVVVLTANVLESGEPVRTGWLFRAGDDPAWASPELDDSGWTRVVPDGLPSPAEGEPWTGIGWLRLRVRSSSELAATNIVAVLIQEGASEVFLDGERTGSWGTPSSTPESEKPAWAFSPPIPLHLETGREHLIAVRYSNQKGAYGGFSGGLLWRFYELENALAQRDARILGETKEAMFLAGAGAALAVLHLLLFVFVPRQPANLWFALFTAALVLIYWADTNSRFAAEPAETLRWFTWGVVMPAVMMPVFGILFALAAFDRKVTLQLWVLAAGALGVLGFYSVQTGWPDLRPQMLFCLVSFLEMLRVLLVAIYKRRPGAWLIGLGFAVFLAVAVGSITLRGASSRFVISLGLLGLLLSFSIYLAMGIARIRRRAERMESENRRQAAELEAARELQLSMLPRERPELDHFDVAFRMWTATEVGGDYYDYRVDGDGRTTLALGDATGHGLDAGHLVVAAKSMFQTLGEGAGLAETMARLSRGIRRLGLRRMNMALMLVRVEGRTVQLSGAGMPPALCWRAASGEVQEVLAAGPPLGTMPGFPYDEKEIALGRGDALLLMTDGLPELVDPSDEMLGYERTSALFAEIAARPAAEVLEHLARAATEFARGRPREDDITLVALRAVDTPPRQAPTHRRKGTG